VIHSPFTFGPTTNGSKEGRDDTLEKPRLTDGEVEHGREVYDTVSVYSANPAEHQSSLRGWPGTDEVVVLSRQNPFRASLHEMPVT